MRRDRERRGPDRRHAHLHTESSKRLGRAGEPQLAGGAAVARPPASNSSFACQPGSRLAARAQEQGFARAPRMPMRSNADLPAVARLAAAMRRRRRRDRQHPQRPRHLPRRLGGTAGAAAAAGGANTPPDPAHHFPQHLHLPPGSRGRGERRGARLPDPGRRCRRPRQHDFHWRRRPPLRPRSSPRHTAPGTGAG
ncbi:MAG: hypothetical protein MZW92_64570 [Comamonadaceae bacterium]|nr:hypothetical protein [Comamonadaceae bacterium]